MTCPPLLGEARQVLVCGAGDVVGAQDLHRLGATQLDPSPSNYVTKCKHLPNTHTHN